MSQDSSLCKVSCLPVDHDEAPPRFLAALISLGIDIQACCNFAVKQNGLFCCKFLLAFIVRFTLLGFSTSTVQWPSAGGARERFVVEVRN